MYGMKSMFAGDTAGFANAINSTPLFMQNRIEQGVEGDALKGDFYELLGNILTKQMNEGFDVDQYRQATKGAINRGFNTSRTRLKEDLAGRGMGGSGAAMAAFAQLGAGRSSALGENEANLQQANIQYKQNALSQLLGLNAFGGGQEVSKNNILLNLLSGLRQQGMFDKELKFREDSQPSEIGQLLGTLLGVGGQAVGTGFATNWGKG